MDRDIIIWASMLLDESYLDNIGESVKLDISEENLPKLQKFLKDNSDTIREGMKWIESNHFKLGFEKGLKNIGYKLVVCPGSELRPYKTDPTETGYGKKNRMIRITEKYLKANPKFTEFEDECGWSYHEFVHALIFSGTFPKEFLRIKSPFGYPMSTDEIYTFGFQIRHITGTPAYGNLLRYECGKAKEWTMAFEMLKDIVTK